MQRLSGVVDLLRRVDEERGAVLAEVKAVITNAFAGTRASLKHLVGAIADMEQLRAQRQASSTSSQVTPFTKASQREKIQVIGQSD